MACTIHLCIRRAYALLEISEISAAVKCFTGQVKIMVLCVGSLDKCLEHSCCILFNCSSVLMINSSYSLSCFYPSTYLLGNRKILKYQNQMLNRNLKAGELLHDE